MDLISILEKTVSPDKTELEAAQRYLEQAAQTNLPEFLKSLSNVLQHANNSPVARMAAGLQLKNALTSKDPEVKLKYQERWLQFPTNVRNFVKQNVLSALGTETLRPSSAAQCVAYIAVAELPRGEWPDLILLLTQNITNINSTEMTKEATLEAIGYICQDIEPDVLVSQSNDILTAIVHGIRKDEPSDHVKLAATTALLNSLEFTKANFEKESVRHFIMQVVCEATQSADTKVKVAALQCLVKIMSLYYQYMEAYMGPALFAITMEAMKSDIDVVALQGIEFWKFLKSSYTISSDQIVELLSIKSNTGKPLFQDEDILDTKVPALSMQPSYPAMQPSYMYRHYSVNFQSINYNLNVTQPQVLNSDDKEIIDINTKLLHIESGDNNISNNRTSFPKFSIGGHFPSLIQSQTYVDKTELISELIHCRNEISSENKVYLITCPRRFGKSSNMAMIKYFLGMEVDKNGEKLKGTDTKFYNILQDIIKTKNIKICDNKHFMQSYFKKFPIIHIDCQNIIGDTLNSLKEHLRLQLYDVFEEHSYLISALYKKLKNLEHDSSDYYDITEDLDNFKKYYSSQALNDAELQNGFKFLSELLSKYYVSYDTNKIHGTQVIILMDEYDAPINCILSQNLKDNTDVIDQIRKFYDHMLCQTFKGNDALYMGIMTGISGMLRALVDSKLNNVLHWKFLGSHNRFQKYYGFNDKEVDFILEQTIHKHNNLNFDKDYYRNKISKYYGGYYNVHDDVHLYNPWSVIRVCEVLNYKKCPDPFKSFWSDTGTIESLDNVFNIPKIRNVIQELIKDGYYPKASNIEYKLLNKLKIAHLIKLNQFSSSNFNSVDHQTDEDLRLFFSYIFELGYITPNRNTTQYSLPNEEIREEFSAKCIEYITQKYNISIDLTNNATSMFNKFVAEPKNEDNAQEFLNSLRNIIQSMNFKKMNDTQEGLHHNEAIFHTLLNWIIMQSRCLRKFGTEVITKHPIELGRADIVYISDSGVGIIVEVKYSNGEEHDLIKNLNNALIQINKKHYDHIFQHPNLKNQIHEGVLKLAVVFNIDNDTNKQVGIKFNYDVINNGVIVKDIEPKLLTSVSDSTVLSDVVMETNTTDVLPAISEDYIDVSLSGNIDLD